MARALSDLMAATIAYVIRSTTAERLVAFLDKVVAFAATATDRLAFMMFASLAHPLSVSGGADFIFRKPSTPAGRRG